MCLTLNGFFAVFKGGPSIRRPGHFKDTLGALNTLDPQPFSDGSVLSEVGDELANSQQERCLLLWRETVKVGAEPAEPFESGHR